MGFSVISIGTRGVIGGYHWKSLWGGDCAVLGGGLLGFVIDYSVFYWLFGWGVVGCRIGFDLISDPTLLLLGLIIEYF